MLYGPFETGYVCRAQTKFSAALYQMQRALKLLCKTLYYLGCAVRGAVIYYKEVKVSLKCSYGADNLLYILLLVVSWNDNQFI